MEVKWFVPEECQYITVSPEMGKDAVNAEK